MESPLFTVVGMFHGGGSLVIEQLLDHVVLDRGGRLLVAMIDVLALLRVDADAELLLVQCHDGSSRALRMAEIVAGEELFLQVHVSEQPGAHDDSWSARLWSPGGEHSTPVAFIDAMSFASFVGQS